jgi:hypothetical protein
MKKISDIASVESKAAFQERLLEKFVQDNLPSRRKMQNKLVGLGDFSLRYKEIESCAAETPVNGTVEIFFETNDPDALRRLSVPAISRFFVFCTRNEMTDYKITSSSSLS